MSFEGNNLQSEELRKLFVGGLARTTTEETYKEYFGQYGEIVDSVILRDGSTKESRGFGFVTFENSDSIEAVFQARPHHIDGKEVEVKRATPREFNHPAAHEKTTRLFVGGFKGLDLEPEELKSYLEDRHPTNFGSLLKIDFLKNLENGTYKGFGFIDVSDTDFADRIAIAERSFSLKGRTMSIKKAESKGPGQEGRGGQRGGRGGRGGGRGGVRGRGGRGGFSSGRQSDCYGGGYNQGGNYNGGNYGQNVYDQGSYQNQSGYGGGYGGGYNQGYGGGYQQQNQGYGNYNQQNTGGAQRASGGNQRYQPY